MTRVYVPGPLAADSSILLPDGTANHIARVLRMRVGEALMVFDGDGGEFEACIEHLERRSVRVALAARRAVDRESPLAITLAQCISRGERMDYTLQKAVELGVGVIVPLWSARSVVRLDAERWEKKAEHWRGVTIAACEQSQRTRLPRVEPPQKLESWLAATAGAGRYVLAPGACTGLRAEPVAPAATLLVGPEGGFDDAELAAAIRSGFTPLGLGPRVLRTETAGIAALAAMQALWGDLG